MLSKRAISARREKLRRLIEENPLKREGVATTWRPFQRPIYCSCCRIPKIASDYYPSKTNSNKLLTICKLCKNAESRAYREKNLGKLSIQRMERHYSNWGTNLEKARAYKTKVKQK